MSLPPVSDNGFCTISDLVRSTHKLGLPHFQRGQVWTDASIASLLESLMLDTPCGSIILWAPADLETKRADYGVRVAEWATEQIEYLVVDGQQRLTALRGVFAGEEKWALNLAAHPHFRDSPDVPPTMRLRKRGLFVRLPEGPKPGASPQTIGLYETRIRDLVSLAEIRRAGAAAWPYASSPPPAWEDFVSGIQHIPDRTLQVVVKRSESLEEIVSLYNRINSSGVAVREEERAFGAMVGFYGKTDRWLHDTFAAIHGKPDTRNDILERLRESRFGFRLFVRAFVQTGSHHLDEDRADLARMDDWVWDDAWMGSEEARKSVFDDAARVITTTARILTDELHCDDLRFLPSADALRPIFTLLLKYPEVEPAIVARALLLLQLEPRVVDHRLEDAEMVRRIRRSNTLGEALSGIPTLGNRGRLAQALRDAKSMQDRWVSLLYWLQRDLGARDYDARALPLSVESAAHKEHIVPFSLLHPAFPDLQARGGHSSRHEANGIGNLTFISEQFNMEHGSEPVALADVDPSVRAPHQLNNSEVLASYDEAIATLRQSAFEPGLAAFRRFTERRLQALTGAMHAWVEKHATADPTDPTMRPAPQRIRPSRADQIRDNRWPAVFEAAVLDLVRDAAAHQTKWILHRGGTGLARNRIANQIRLWRDGVTSRDLDPGILIDLDPSP